MTRLRERESFAWMGSAIVGFLMWVAPAAAQDWGTIDEVMNASLETRMAEFGVPGAVVTIVRDDAVIYEGAFGFADVEAGEPVHHSDTLFRLASISKTFTALAAVQLAGEGVLDLDAPITEYLGEATPPMPLGQVTMRHLLTHTSGFDNTDVGDAALRAQDVLSLEAYVATRMTPQASAPGALRRYSNPGIALAGRAIEVVSGQTYDAYMRDDFFAPLGMASSTFAQPAPLELEARLVRGHEAETHTALARDFTQTPPADALLSSGADMGRYMLAMLSLMEAGEGGALFTRQFSHTDGIPAQALGWEEEMWRGRYVYSHSGGQLGFTSFVALVPEERLGFFIALNARAGAARGLVLNDFIEAFLPRPEGGYGGTTPIQTPHDVSDYVGDYRSLDYPYGNFERVAALLGLFGHTARVTEAGRQLHIGNSNYAEIAPDTFQLEMGWPSIWRFERNEQGQVTGAYSGRNAFDRVGLLERPMILMAALALPFLAGLLRLTAIPLWRRMRGYQRRGSLMVLGASLAVVIGIGGTVASIANAMSGAVQLDYGLPSSLEALFMFNGIVVVLAALALPAALLYWRKGAAWIETVTALALLPAALAIPYLGLASMP